MYFEENSSIGSKHLESCQITKMIGNDWIEIFVEDDAHRFDLHRVTVAFEDIINTFGWVIFPSVYLTMIAGLVKTVGV